MGCAWNSAPYNLRHCYWLYLGELQFFSGTLVMRKYGEFWHHFWDL